MLKFNQSPVPEAKIYWIIIEILKSVAQAILKIKSIEYYLPEFRSRISFIKEQSTINSFKWSNYAPKSFDQKPKSFEQFTKFARIPFSISNSKEFSFNLCFLTYAVCGMRNSRRWYFCFSKLLFSHSLWDCFLFSWLLIFASQYSFYANLCGCDSFLCSNYLLLFVGRKRFFPQSNLILQITSRCDM